jgi:hypothetical protein
MVLFHEILVNLSLLCSVVVAIAAVIGLYQLILTKRASQQSAKREAFKLASEQCKYYLTEVIKFESRLSDRSKGLGISTYGTSKLEIRGDSLFCNVRMTISVKQTKDIAEELVKVLNALEVFSVPIKNGVASDSVAFNSVGRTFCHTVEELLPILLMLHKEGGYYKNTIKLFSLWYRRLQKADIEQQAILLRDEASGIIDYEIKPIGT